MGSSVSKVEVLVFDNTLEVCVKIFWDIRTQLPQVKDYLYALRETIRDHIDDFDLSVLDESRLIERRIVK